jgi:hypothetical protein
MAEMRCQFEDEDKDGETNNHWKHYPNNEPPALNHAPTLFQRFDIPLEGIQSFPK